MRLPLWHSEIRAVLIIADMYLSKSAFSFMDKTEGLPLLAETFKKLAGEWPLKVSSAPIDKCSKRKLGKAGEQ